MAGGHGGAAGLAARGLVGGWFGRSWTGCRLLTVREEGVREREKGNEGGE